MIKRILLLIGFSWVCLLNAGGQVVSSLDPRLNSLEGKIRLVSKYQPAGDDWYEYKIFEREGELIIVYARKEKILKVISLCGEKTKNIPPSKIIMTEDVMKFRSHILRLVDSGKRGSRIY